MSLLRIRVGSIRGSHIRREGECTGQWERMMALIGGGVGEVQFGDCCCLQGHLAKEPKLGPISGRGRSLPKFLRL